MEIKKLIAVAAGEIHHIYNGLCPDSQTGANSRDDECPACQIIIAAETESAKARGVAINLDETRLNELERLPNTASPAVVRELARRLRTAEGATK